MHKGAVEEAVVAAGVVHEEHICGWIEEDPEASLLVVVEVGCLWGGEDA